MAAVSIGVVAPMLGGCAASRASSRTVAVPEETRRLAVDIRNVRGSVELRVNPRVEGAIIESNARVTTKDDFSPEKDRDIVDGLAVSAEVIGGDDGNAVLKIVSSSSRPDAEDQAVDLMITVPRCDGVSIDNRGGLVMVVGASGAHSITNRDGPVEVRTNTPITDPVTLTTTDGNIYYQVPSGSSGAFDLLTMRGECAFRNEVTDVQKETYATREMLATVLNNGENPVVARTNQGDVRVWVIKDPVGLTRMYKKTIPDFRDLLYQDGSQRYMRNLPDDAKRNTEYERWYNIR
ncbi:MAG: DUF4097 family beta strand repeat-containing protein [Phycisphaerales bacterium]